jgi:RimJ/RimL family protein N-acetyltransferase
MGYATEAARLLVRFGFEEIGLQTITAACRRENTGSRRIMEKCGFKATGADGSRLYYELEHGEWIADS